MPISEETKTKWKNKLKAIETEAEDGALELSEWEIDFLDTVNVTLSKDKELSFKQSKCLNRIYERI